MWIVNGTTRKGGSTPEEASIITARSRPVSAARYSVWPGKPKPAAVSTDLWIGAVTIAAALPLRHASTARAIAPVTALAFAGEGWPGSARTAPPISTIAASSPRGSTLANAAAFRKTSVLPISSIGRPRTDPLSCDQALTATSGPMPEGSP